MMLYCAGCSMSLCAAIRLALLLEPCLRCMLSGSACLEAQVVSLIVDDVMSLILGDVHYKALLIV